MRYKLLSAILICALLLTGCGRGEGSGNSSPVFTGESALGGAEDAFGEDLQTLGVYDGYFEEAQQPLEITCISGTENCYRIEGETIYFTQLSEDSVYSISGQFKGNIVIDAGEDYKLDLELRGFSLVSESISPIVVLSGDEVSITAKKGFQSYIYDKRPAVDAAGESAYSAAIYSAVDLEICGKGSLTLISENNNGIHSKDDLQVKNLTLFVYCADNALKGNDSVSVENSVTTLIAAAGDGIKTTNSHISDNGKQRGTISISGGTHSIYAACDGIDAAYDVIISDEATALNIYTDKYSTYSKEVTAVDEAQYYIRFTSNAYRYSVKYYNSDEDFCWVEVSYHSAVNGGRSTYYYYSYPIMEGYNKVQFFIYGEGQAPGQDTDYLACTDCLSINTAYDTFALYVRGNQLGYEWTNYSTSINDNAFGPGGPGGPGGGGMGGMNEGNPDKGDHSTKGIKANNQITIEGGTIAMKAYDDAIHANSDNALENGASATGNITINGGNLTIYTNDDALHADGTLTVNDGTIVVENSFEGMEGAAVAVHGGKVSILASDDGINATASSGTAITINGGTLYILCSGDGMDANSRTAYAGIVFNGGNTVVVSTSGGNSAIDTEQGYTYNGGKVIAIMPSGGMSNEAIHCQNFQSIATSKNMSLSAGQYLVIQVDSKQVSAVKMPVSINGIVIYLGSDDATFSSKSNASDEFDGNGVCWN